MYPNKFHYSIQHTYTSKFIESIYFRISIVQNNMIIIINDVFYHASTRNPSSTISLLNLLSLQPMTTPISSDSTHRYHPCNPSVKYIVKTIHYLHHHVHDHPDFLPYRSTAWATALYIIYRAFTGAPIFPSTFSTIPNHRCVFRRLL